MCCMHHHASPTPLQKARSLMHNSEKNSSEPMDDLFLTGLLSHASCIECWSNSLRGERNLICHQEHRERIRVNALSVTIIFYTLASDDNNDSSSSTRTVSLYNDDAFGLGFLSSLFVAKDYTFAATFASLSFLAVIMVQFAGVKFTSLVPRLCGFIVITFIVGNVVTEGTL